MSSSEERSTPILLVDNIIVPEHDSDDKNVNVYNDTSEWKNDNDNLEPKQNYHLYWRQGSEKVNKTGS